MSLRRQSGSEDSSSYCSDSPRPGQSTMQEIDRGSSADIRDERWEPATQREWQIRLDHLEWWIRELLIENQRLRMSLGAAEQLPQEEIR